MRAQPNWHRRRTQDPMSIAREGSIPPARTILCGMGIAHEGSPECRYLLEYLFGIPKNFQRKLLHSGNSSSAHYTGKQQIANGKWVLLLIESSNYINLLFAICYKRFANTRVQLSWQSTTLPTLLSWVRNPSPAPVLSILMVMGFEVNERRPVRGKVSATIVVRNDSE